MGFSQIARPISIFETIISSKNISVLEIALIVSCLNRIFCLLRCSPHCHVFCALCYFIVVDTFSHRVALFSVTDSSSLIVIIRLFSKCKNDKGRMGFFSSKIYVSFPSQIELIKILCSRYVTFDVRLLKIKKGAPSLICAFSFSHFPFIGFWVLKFTRSMLVMDDRRLMAELLRRVVAKTPRLNSRVSVLSSHFRSKKSIFRSMKSDRRNVLRCCLEILKKLKFSSIGLETNNL